MIFPDPPNVLQEKIDKIDERLSGLSVEIEDVQSENDFFRQFDSLFAKFKTDFIERLKVRVAYELANTPNDEEHAFARERLSGRFDQLVDLQRFEDGVGHRLTILLTEKAKLLKEKSRMQGELSKQVKKQEREAVNA